jgi:hypothetical protein
MEYVLLALAAGAMGVGWWWLGKRRKELLGDSDDPSSLIPRSEQGPPEVFTRESLLGRPRNFDPRAWDDGPDGEASAGPATGAEEDLPSRFDRSYLERTSKRPPAADPAPRPATPPPAGPPVPLPTTGEEELPTFLDREFLERRQRERSGQQPPPADDPDA